MTTHPPGQPSGPTGPGRLPRLGEVIRDAERLLAQALSVLDRAVDPASEPDVLAWPEVSASILLHDLLLADVALQLRYAQQKLGRVAELPLPPVGSAIKVPSRMAPGQVDDFARNVIDALRRQADVRRPT